MARTRSIKPGFFLNERLAELHPLTRILFAGLWCNADRAGRLEDRPKKIKVEVLPYDDHDVDRAMTDLQSAGFIKRYSNNGGRYIQILTFNNHQNPHVREPNSTIPAPDEHSASPVLGTAKARDIPITDHPLPSTLPPFHPSTLPPFHPSTLPPDHRSLSLEDAQSASSLSSDRRKKRAARLPAVKIPPKGAAAWECYSAAYRARYGVEPVRNGKTNGCLKSLVSRLPADDLAGVIAWYVEHNGAVYVASKHCVELLLRDAEGLHTEWARGEHMTSRRAREVDSLQTSLDAVEAVMKKHPEWRSPDE